MAAPHRLAIDLLSTRVRPAPGMAEDWAVRIEDAMRGPIPRRLGEEIEHRFEGRDAVIRIRRLRLVWHPEGAVPDMAALADLLARQVVAALDAAMAGPGPSGPSSAPDVRVWPDHARYTAAWVRHRLGIARDADWPFPDFAALAVLTGAEAATEVLAVSGAPVLAALARTPDEARAIATAIGETGALRVLAALTGTAVPGAEALRAAQARMPQVPVAPGAEATAVLAALLAPGGVAPDPADLPAMALAMLARAGASSVLRAGGTVRDLTRPDPACPPGTSDLARTALAAFTRDPGLRLRLLKSLPEAETPASRKPFAQASPAGPAAVRPPAPGRVIHSAFGGLAPLLALCPLTGAPAEVIRRVALDLLPEAARPEAALDPGLACLFPADPHAAPEPPPDPAETAWAGLGTLAGEEHRQGFGAQADLWLARFAARLQGLQGSSRAYLAREFLLRPGRIEPAQSHLHVTLPPIPLGIVLRMSGLTGLTPVIAHLGLPLLIELER